MTIENTVSSNFDSRSSIVKSIFDCRLPGVLFSFSAPVDCPYGGSLHTDGWCYVVSSVTANWETAKADCVNSYNGYLASLKDQSTHTHASNQMTSIR